jgi:uncharacterized glyoxalase superfamily protein PhnB
MQVGDDAAIILAEGAHNQVRPSGSRAFAFIKVRIEDVDAIVESAGRCGAKIVQHPADLEFGERAATVEELAGHRWQFTQTIRDVAPEKRGGRTVDPPR